MLSTHDPSTLSAWTMLQTHAQALRKLSMRQLFKEDLQRFEHFSIQAEGILLDYSKNILTQQTRAHLCTLAQEMDIAGARHSMFSGEKINATEERAVLHTALRRLEHNPLYTNGSGLQKEIHRTLQQIKHFAQAIHTGAYKGFTGKPIQHIVHLGIGGSMLGPQMVISCLEPYCHRNIQVHFVGNMDAAEWLSVRKKIQADTTLFFIVSKTFTTAETMRNAQEARAWFTTHTQDPRHLAQHFMAITAATEKARAFGIAEKNVFPLWDAIGGRYSLWSSVGLSIACVIGFDNFSKLLAGAHGMDQHFLTAPEPQNMPILLGLLSLWYRNFWHANGYAVLCYSYYMRGFPAYLQQLSMESNGKGTDRKGQPVHYPTAPILFGGVGTHAQHSFYQLLHQGTSCIPCDFIAIAQSPHACDEQHEDLLTHFFAHTRALMQGRTEHEVREDLQTQGLSPERQAYLLPFKTFTGNRPTNSLLLEKLNPETLGALIALYEHKIFVEGVLWNIFSFDQWGVELGKHIAQDIQAIIKKPSSKVENLDSSTRGLINAYRAFKKKPDKS